HPAPWSGCGNGLVSTSPNVRTAAMGPWYASLCPSLTGLGLSREAPQGCQLGLGMTEPWTRRLCIFSYHEWTGLAPRGQCASAASGAASVPGTLLLWGYLGARHGGGRPR